MGSTEKSKVAGLNSTVYVIFFSLLLDLLAFTMILPLLPSLMEHYRLNDNTGLYDWLLHKVKFFQTFVGAPDQYASVLFGGFLGSMFSFLQFVASPIVGGISDSFGRKPVMIVCLVGIALSYVVWAFSHNLVLFILARILGGISKGNVSLSMAVIADVSSMETRGIGMALVGLAFSLGFIIGPLIGAFFAVVAKPKIANWYIYPAGCAFVLAFLDLIFFVVYFKESLPRKNRANNIWEGFRNAKSLISIPDLFQFHALSNISATDLSQLRKLGLIYFVYLFIYSGLEFTLTFLTHHLFHYNSMQQGWMFFTIGIIMASFQGGYVCKLPATKVKSTAVCGLWLIVPSFIVVGLASNKYMLYIGLLLFAVSTAFVTPCMMTMASSYGSPAQKGTVMGIFRSLGALARALGPIFASIAFWSFGSSVTYIFGAAALLWPVLALQKSI